MAQPAIETTSTLNGLFKEVYADNLKDLVPESDVLLGMDNFVSKEMREGNKYHQPVVLSLPSGATWGLGIVTLNNAIASQLGDAQIQGSAITHRDLLAYDAAAKAAKGGKQSFMEATSLVVKNLVKAEAKFLEIDLLYGSGSTATAGNSLGQTTSVSNTNGTTEVVTITYGTWAPAIWAGMENAIVQFYNGSTLIGSGAGYTITAVNVAAASSTQGGTITVTGTAADITSLNGFAFGTLDIFWNTSAGNQMAGLRLILNNTGSLFNINATSFNLWQSNIFDCQSTQLTFGKIQSAVALCVNRGLDTKALILVSPPTFANLVDEQAGARLYDNSYKEEEATNGFKRLEFFSSNGVIEIVPHIFLHQGEAMVIPEEEFIRCGPVENVTSTLPGMPGEFFVQSQTFAAYELRCYGNQACFLEAPAHAGYIKNVVNV